MEPPIEPPILLDRLLDMLLLLLLLPPLPSFASFIGNCCFTLTTPFCWLVAEMR